MDLKTSVGILGKPILIGRRSPGEVDGVDLGHICGKRSWAGVHLVPAIRGAAAIDIEAGQDLRNRLIDPQHHLDVADRMAARYGDGILGTNCCRLHQKGIPDFLFYLLDFLNRLFLSQVIELESNISWVWFGGRGTYKKIDVRSRCNQFMIVLT